MKIKIIDKSTGKEVTQDEVSVINGISLCGQYFWSINGALWRIDHTKYEIRIEE